MLDPKYFRQDIEQTAAKLQDRGFILDIERIKTLEAQRKALSTQTQELQNERNIQSKAIGQAKSRGKMSRRWC